MKKRPEKVCKHCGGPLTLRELYDLNGYCFLCAKTHGNVQPDERDIERALRRERLI